MLIWNKKTILQVSWVVETLADGYLKKIPLPRVPSIAQAQAHTAHVHLYRTLVAGTRHTKVPRVTRVPSDKGLTLTPVPLGHGTQVPLSSGTTVPHRHSQRIHEMSLAITSLARAFT